MPKKVVKPAPKETAEEGGIARAEVLSGKKLPAGLATLAVVRKCDRHTVSLCLPHGLMAVARAADVNPVAASLAVGIPVPGDSDDDDDDDDDAPAGGAGTEALGLRGLFVPGQYVSCVVLRASDESGAAKKSAVPVSLNPVVVNDGMSMSHLTKDNSVVWGYVQSKEDHGFVVELGIAGVHAFLPFKTVAGGPAALSPGFAGFFHIVSVKKGASSVVLGYDPARKEHTTSQAGDLSLTSIKPGMRVNVAVKKSLRNGLFVSFLNFFQGTIDLWHLPMPASAYWASSYDKDAMLSARVLFVNLATKMIGLSAAPHVVSLSPVTFDLAYGNVVDPATIVRVDPGVGVTLSFSAQEGDAGAAVSKKASKKPETSGKINALCQWGAIAFCHVSKLTDGHVEHIERTFTIGSSVQCRVVGFSPMEGLVNVSMQPSILKASVLSYAELSPAQVLTGTIATIDNFGVLVNLGQGIRGVVTVPHVSDSAFNPKKPSVKVGATVKVRVLDVDASRQKCHLTMKRSLLDSTLPVLTSYEQASEGAPTLVSHGFVTALRPGHGVVVTFYNNVHGTVSEKELEKAGLGSLEDCSHMMGTTVKARVHAVDVAKRRMQLSLRLSAVGLSAGGDVSAAVANYPVGSLVAGTVVSVTSGSTGTASAVVKLLGVKGKEACHGLLPLLQCGDSQAEAEAAFRMLKAAKKLSEVLVMEHHGPGKNDGYPVTLSLKPLLLSAAKLGATFITPRVDTVSPGALLAGYVSSLQPYGVFVKFAGGFSALAPKSMLSDAMVEDVQNSNLFTVGQSVWTVVQSVDTEAKRVVLNLKPSRVLPLVPGGAPAAAAAASSKKRKAAVDAEADVAAADPKAAKQQKVKAAKEDMKHDLTAEGLSVGTTVQCRIEPIGAPESAAAHAKTVLPVTLLGVAGRYKARLTLSECCDVCPFTGRVINSEGSDTFKRLIDSSVAGNPPVFRAKVVLVRVGKAKKQKEGSTKPPKAAPVDIELTIRPSDLKLADGMVAYPRLAFGQKPEAEAELHVSGSSVGAAAHVSRAGFVAGGWMWGVVERTCIDSLSVGLGGGVHGKLPVLEADRGSSSAPADQVAVLNDIAQGRRYAPGSPVLVVITQVDPSNKLLLLSGHRAPTAIAAAAKVAPGRSLTGHDATTIRSAVHAAAGAVKQRQPFAAGAFVYGQIVSSFVPAGKQQDSDTNAACTGTALKLRLDEHTCAVVSAVHSADRAKWADSPFSSYVIGQVIYGVVIPDLASAKSKKVQVVTPPAGGSGEEPVSDDEEGDDDVDSDADTIPDPKASKGKAHRAATPNKVLSVSLRPSWIDLAVKKPSKVAELFAAEEAAERETASVVGNVVSGFVDGTNPKGCFIMLARGLMGRSLLKNLSDGFVKDVKGAFPVGKLVAGRVLAVQAGGNVDITLKGSEVTGTKTLVKSKADVRAERGALEASSDSDEADSDAETVPAFRSGKRAASDSESESEDSEDVREGSGDEEFDAEDVDLKVKQVKPLKRAKFDWDEGGDNEAEDGAGADGDTKDAEDALWDSGAAGEDQEQHVGRRAKASAKKRLDTEIDRQEKRLASDDFVPESAADFERMVLASPHNSLVWIQYMAFQLSVTEIEGARAVAERALKAISYRDEQEKMNVWVAFLNLEHSYGDAASLSAMFARALQHNNPKKIHAHMLSMYEARGKNDEAIALYQIATRKFSTSKKFWINWASFLMKTGNAEGARGTLTRALTMLPKRKHVAVIEKFALMEYKNGFAERGRTIFEGLLSSEPKRVDIWSVYVDQEVSSGDVEHARRLLERVIHLKLSSKKMQFFFKKYLAFESQHGTPETVQHVRDAAKAYVESLAS